MKQDYRNIKLKLLLDNIKINEGFQHHSINTPMFTLNEYVKSFNDYDKKQTKFKLIINRIKDAWLVLTGKANLYDGY